MEKNIKQSSLQQQKDYLNEEISKFENKLKADLKNLRKDINSKLLAEEILKEYIQRSFDFNGNSISSEKLFKFPSRMYIDFSTLNPILAKIPLANSQEREKKLKELEPDIKNIIKEFLNTVIDALNNCVKDYTFYLVSYNCSFISFDAGAGRITCSVNFKVDFY